MRFKLKSDGKTYETRPARLHEGRPTCMPDAGCYTLCSFVGRSCSTTGAFPYCSEHKVVFMEVKDVPSNRT